MIVTLDGQVLFDQQQLEIELGSLSRATVERMIPGLDGVLSIDMGGRGRKIKQKGLLRAKSQAEMESKIGAISAYMDGQMHTLTIDDEIFENLRMDAFKVGSERAGGSGMEIDYEIVYTQLG